MLAGLNYFCIEYDSRITSFCWLNSFLRICILSNKRLFYCEIWVSVFWYKFTWSFWNTLDWFCFWMLKMRIHHALRTKDRITWFNWNFVFYMWKFLLGIKLNRNIATILDFYFSKKSFFCNGSEKWDVRFCGHLKSKNFQLVNRNKQMGRVLLFFEQK